MKQSLNPEAGIDKTGNTCIIIHKEKSCHGIRKRISRMYCFRSLCGL